MSDQLLGLRLFVRVARTGSFSRAAKDLKLSQPTASRMITVLEDTLGVTLFTRTTRAITLTDPGAAYLERIQPILDALDEADQAVRGTGELRGSLRARGTPVHPDDLAAHSAIVAGPTTGTSWRFTAGTREVVVAVDGNLAVTSSEVGINAGVAGLGLVAASYPALKAHLERGELVRVLADWSAGELELHALFASGQAGKPAARTFVDYLVRALADL